MARQEGGCAQVWAKQADREQDMPIVLHGVATWRKFVIQAVGGGLLRVRSVPILDSFYEVTSHYGPQDWAMAAAIVVLVYFCYTVAVRPHE